MKHFIFVINSYKARLDRKDSQKKELKIGLKKVWCPLKQGSILQGTDTLIEYNIIKNDLNVYFMNTYIIQDPVKKSLY